jgi:hypothetical protein
MKHQRRPFRNEVIWDPVARGFLTELEKLYIDFFWRQRRHRLRRHTKPFAKTFRGLARRKTRLFVRLQEHTIKG